MYPKLWRVNKRIMKEKSLLLVNKTWIIFGGGQYLPNQIRLLIWLPREVARGLKRSQFETCYELQA
ncbi:hypothetical protein OIU76_003314 [Salix suchowensis]|nr:hypothetical protein OIU76_003314 [Salix suchowensis]